jgi:lysyl-tRNA synthetase class 1
VAYYQDFVKSSKKFRLPNDKERAALQDLVAVLRDIPEDESAEFIQNEVYEAGKRHFAKEELRQWFKALYEVLLGSEQGPRMGAFIQLYGRDNVVALIERALAGEDLGKAA